MEEFGKKDILEFMMVMMDIMLWIIVKAIWYIKIYPKIISLILLNYVILIMNNQKITIKNKL